VILAAGVLVLLGAGLFVAGLVTDATDLYWLCVAACAAAGLLLVVARLRTARPPASALTSAEPSTPVPGATPATAPATSEAVTSESVTSEPGTGSPADAPAEPAPSTPPEATAAAAQPPRSTAVGGSGDPPVEDVEVTDLLLVMDLHDEVLVVDEHPRYHLAGCRWLRGRATVPLPLDEARRDGFTPCARCTPDRTLAQRERSRRTGRGS
jgi:hypothetical protein